MTIAGPRWTIPPLPPLWAWLASGILHALILGVAARLPAPESDELFEPIRIVMVEPAPPPLGLPGAEAKPEPPSALAAPATAPEEPRQDVPRPAERPKPAPLARNRPAQPPAPDREPTPAVAAVPEEIPAAAPVPFPASAGRPDDAAVGLAAGASAGRGDTPLPAGRVARPPRILHRVPPEYPLRARAEGLEGEVLIEAVVDRRGEVEDPVKILHSVPGLDTAALEAVRRWRFRPAEDERGRPVPVIVEIPIRFVLR